MFIAIRGDYYFMNDIFINRLEEEMRKQGFNYKSLSRSAGLGETNVRDIITRRSLNPRRDTLQKIAAVLGKPLAHFLGEDYTQTVRVVGEITPDKKLAARAALLVSEHTPPETIERVETPPELGHRDLVALRVKGNALYPFMPDGTLVYYSETTTQPPFGEYIDTLCIIQIENGVAVLRKLKYGEQFDTYNLEDFYGDKIENAQVEWCAKIKFIKLP